MIKKRIVAVLLVVILFLLPFISMTVFLFCAPMVYHNTFLAALSEKYERLNTMDGEKVVVIGGSSVAFGIDSKQLEKSIGIPAVNFGMYASLGSKVMLDLSRNAINPGDIVVLAFEMDNQTLSMYFNADSMWQAIDCDYTLLKGVDTDDYGKMSGALFGYFKDKIGFLKNGAPNPEGVYNIHSFDEYGDIIFERKSNILPIGFDPNQMISLEDIHPDAEFADYVNEYIEYVQRKGAKVCLSFCPMNRLAVEGESSDKDAFVSRLDNAFDASYIGDIENYIYDSKYFYDTNFHLNDYGSFMHTQQLARDLAEYYDLTYTVLTPPAGIGDASQNDTADRNDMGGAEFEDYFVYEDFFGAGWAICGITEKAKECIEIDIPVYHDGKKILAILPGALEGCNALETIRIVRGEGNSLTLYDGAFSNAKALQSVLLYAKPDTIKISTEGLLYGASADLRFYVEKQNYASYVTDYYWSIYAEKTQLME